MSFLEFESDYERDTRRSSKGGLPIFGTLITLLVVALIFCVYTAITYKPDSASNAINKSEIVVTIDTTLSYEGQIQSIITQIGQQAQNANTLEKYKLLHDFTTKAMEYDYKSIRPGVDLSFGKGPNDPAKALNTGLGVCGAYAQLYKDLCDKAGLMCEFVYGKAFILGNTGISGHAWNAVNMDGKWYHVDCCWSDTGGGLYDYYMRGERFIQVGDGGNFREMYNSNGITISETDYKFDRSQSYANIVVKRY